jgi:hypothetical protein
MATNHIVLDEPERPGPKTADEIHGRRCPCCDGGLVRVVAVAGTTCVSCDRCAAPGRVLCARFGVPLSAVIAACERWA